jgi:HSP20 family protein
MKPNEKFGPEWTESAFGAPSSFDDFLLPDTSFEKSGVTTPAVNIIDTREDLRVEMVAPGMNKDAFKIEVQSEILTIYYEHEDNRADKQNAWKYKLREHNYHSFVRSFYLPDTVEADRIEASYKDGMLRLLIPKKKEAISRQIDVK